MLDNLVTLNLSINKQFENCYDIELLHENLSKHLFVIRRILLEALSLNFCGSGDSEISFM